MRFTPVSILSAALLASACSVNLGAERITQREERRFQVSGTPEIVLTTFDGGIEVRSWDRPDVLVTIEKQAESAEAARAIAVKVEQNGNRITVDVPKPQLSEGIGWNVSRSANLIVSTPRASNLHARSGDGGIRLEGLSGQLEVRSGDGGITGRDLGGTLTVRTGDGGVSLDEVKGTLALDTGDGGVKVSGALTKLVAHTGDGSMDVTVAAGSRMDEDWELTSGDGAVTVALPDGFNADVDAHTGDGGITVEGLALPKPTGDERDTLRGSLGSGGKLLRVRTGDGGIRLRRS
jgi:DUF4097 and DUF4098 domain-containing protein YvlB